MDLGLSGRTAIVAAASKGLGKAVATALAREGTNVVIFSRDAAAIRDTAEEIRTIAVAEAEVMGLVADVTVPAALAEVARATITHFGAVDILYNNAGGPKPGYFDELTDDDWEHAFQLTLMSAIRLTRACLPIMRQRRWGRIITGTSSTVKEPIPTMMLSNSLRSAVTAWSKTLADQVAREGITVNTLAPGRLDTARVRQLDEDLTRREAGDFSEMRARLIGAIPLGRYGDPEEFGAAAAFLASEQASYITGVTLLVDGGQYRGLS
ncbi:MAG: SDR family oxidoreductase [Thermomicrobiales bacterium]